MSLSASANTEKTTLTATQLQRMKSNREKALQLQKARIANIQNAENAINKKETCTVSCPRDTGAGFFAEDEDLDSQNPATKPLVTPPAPLFSEDRPSCLECQEDFSDSYLHTHFNHPVCDSCRDKDGAHMLMSRTDAKKEYLLKDCDLDKREPILKFILRKNPHNKFGNMKLYLRLQIEERALLVHETEDAIEDKKDQLEEAQLKRKKKAFDKKVKALESIQSNFSVVSFLVCAGQFISCCSALGSALQSSWNVKRFYEIIDIFYTITNSLGVLVFLFFIAGQVPIELDSLNEVFLKKGEQNFLMDESMMNEKLVPKWLLQMPSTTLSGCKIIIFKRYSILAVAGTILTYGLLVMNLDNRK